MNHKSTPVFGTLEVARLSLRHALVRRVRRRGALRTSSVFVAMLAAVAASLAAGPSAMADTAPVMTSSPPPVGVVGNGYIHMFQVSSQVEDPVFSVTAGSLPPGLTLQSTGFVTGTPTIAGSFGPTTVCGANNVVAPACQTFTLDVHKRWPSILASASAGGVVGTPVHETASLVGAFSPTGSVTFRLFSDAACTVEVFRSTNAVSQGSATSTDVTPPAPGTYRWTTSYSGDADNEQASTPCDPSNSVVITAQNSLYHAITPARILDTRNGAPVAAGGTIVQSVTGVGGVPASGVSAVVLDVTVTQPTSSSFLTVYADGGARPPTANLNFVPDQTVTNLVVAEVGADGKVAIFNAAGSTHVVVDVDGWFESDGATSGGGRYSPVPATRILDTRTGAPVAPGGTIVEPVIGVGGVPASGVSAVVLDVSVTQPTASSFLTVYPDGEARPLTADLNFVAGQTVTNLVVAKVGADGKVALFNYAGSTHVVIDVVGWFGSDGATAGGRYSAVSPTFLLDTRSGAPVAPGGTIVQPVTGVGGVPASGVSAVVLDVSVTQPTSSSFLTVYPDGAARPLAADLNFVAGQTVTTLVVAAVGTDGKVAIFNYAGSTHVVISVVGWYST